MRFYTSQHQFYCGIDLHARTMFICIMDQSGSVLLHRNYRAGPEEFLRAVSPYREDIVVAVECIFTWYWIADLCVREEMDFVLGHALYMKAIHGGKTKNDKIDSQKIAALLRSGMFPLAYVYPQSMRATRDLLRRRLYLARQHAELQTHIQSTNMHLWQPSAIREAYRSQIQPRRHRDTLHRPCGPHQCGSGCRTDGLSSRADPHDRAPDQCPGETTEHDPVAVHLLRTIPGVGKILALVILYEIHDINRFPKVGNFISYARLVKCAHESAGKRKTGKNSKIGNVHLKWAFSEAACLFLPLRGNERAKLYHQKLVSRYGKAKALSIIAQKLGRTAYTILKRRTPFDAKRFFETVG